MMLHSPAGPERQLMDPGAARARGRSDTATDPDVLRHRRYAQPDELRFACTGLRRAESVPRWWA